MPTTVFVHVDGLRELGERMSRLSAKMAGRAAKQATAAAAGVIKKRAKNKLRANPSVDTGLLEKNVVVRRNTKTRLTSEHVVGVRRVEYPGGKRNTVQVGGYVEFGTVKMTPEPYLRPAIDEGADEALDAMVSKLDYALSSSGV